LKKFHFHKKNNTPQKLSFLDKKSPKRKKPGLSQGFLFEIRILYNLKDSFFQKQALITWFSAKSRILPFLKNSNHFEELPHYFFQKFIA
jgi:hypothetical protein